MWAGVGEVVGVPSVGVGVGALTGGGGFPTLLVELFELLILEDGAGNDLVQRGGLEGAATLAPLISCRLPLLQELTEAVLAQGRRREQGDVLQCELCQASSLCACCWG